MVRLYLLMGVVVVAFYVFSIVDCALYDHMRVKALPKPAWVLIVLLIPVIGGLLWFAFGRSGKGADARARPMAPDDDPEFLGSLGRDNAEMQERIRRLEQEFSDLGDEAAPGTGGGSRGASASDSGAADSGGASAADSSGAGTGGTASGGTASGGASGAAGESTGRKGTGRKEPGRDAAERGRPDADGERHGEGARGDGVHKDGVRKNAKGRDSDPKPGHPDA